MYWYHMFGIKQAQKDTQLFQKYLLSGLGKSDEWSGKKDSYVTPALSGDRKRFTRPACQDEHLDHGAGLIRTDECGSALILPR